jgi:FSR family fosmidomycin resistance protein-like MFS transporter
MSLGHFTIDVYANLLPVMFPLLVVPLGLNYIQVGFAATTFTITSSLMQPVFGHLGDRFGSRYLAPLGVAWIATFMGLVSFAWDYSSLLVLIALAGLGSAAFHPQGAMNAGFAAGPQRATGMSIFSLGGSAGFSLGPVIGGAIFTSALGLRGSAVLIPFGLVVAIYLHGVIAAIDHERHNSVVIATAVRREPVVLARVAALVIVVMLRSWSLSALTTYVPLLYRAWGLGLAVSSQTLFVLLASGAVGVLIGGYLADRLGARKVVALSLFFFAPAIGLFLLIPMPASLIFALLAGLFGEASLPVTLVMAQELLPRNVGMASGLILGLAFVAGGIGVSITGLVADQYGLYFALMTLTVLPLVAALLCLRLPTVRQAVTS